MKFSSARFFFNTGVGYFGRLPLMFKVEWYKPTLNEVHMKHDAGVLEVVCGSMFCENRRTDPALTTASRETENQVLSRHRRPVAYL